TPPPTLPSFPYTTLFRSLETELAAEAADLGLPLTEYALRLLAGGGNPRPAPRNGVELLAYWQGEGVVRTRPEITDAAAHARSLRSEEHTSNSSHQITSYA